MNRAADLGAGHRSSLAGGRPSRAGVVALYLVTASLAAWCSSHLAVSYDLYLWYAPSGLMLAGLLIAGWKWSPVAFAGRLCGAFAVGTGNVHAWRVVASAAFATAVYAAGSEVVRRKWWNSQRSSRAAEMLGLCLTGAGVSVVSAVGLTALMWVDLHQLSLGFSSTAWNLFVGDLTGILVICPALLTWPGHLPRLHAVAGRAHPGRPSARAVAQLCATSVLAAALGFWAAQTQGHHFYVTGLLLLMALCCGLPASVGAVTAFGVAVALAAHFSGFSPSGLRSLSLFVIATAVAILVVASWEEDRRAGAAKYRSLLEGAGDAFIAIDGAGRVCEWNAAATRLFGWRADEALGADLATLIIPEEQRAAHRAALRRREAEDGDLLPARRMELRALRHDGQELEVQLSIWMTGEPGRRRYNALIHDVSRRHRQQALLRRLALELTEARDNEAGAARAAELSAARFAALVEHSSDVTTITSAEGQLLYASPAFERLLGRSVGHAIGTLRSIELHPEDRSRVLAERRGVVADPSRTASYVCRVRHADGSWRHVAVTLRNHTDDPAVGGLVANICDVTDATLLAERLLHESTHDALTNLPNRTLLLERLQTALQRAGDVGGVCAVVYIDLDRFKQVNDSLGHPAGDRLLATVGKRLGKLVRPADTVARLGGDEFVVLVEGIGGPEAALDLARRICAGVCEPVWVDGTTIVPTLSAGVAMGSPGQAPHELLQQGDIAMYRAKDHGRNCIELYRETFGVLVRRHQAAEQLLRSALERGALLAAYQPIVDLRDGAVAGYEALARIRDPRGRMVMPGDFIAVAEETGLIEALGEEVLSLATDRMATIASQQPGAPYMSVNLSPVQLRREGFVDTVARALCRHQLDPSSICLELTESSLVDSGPTGRRILDGLKELGVRLALDDFGTGWSSLSYLHRFPLDIIKIDRSFVARLGLDQGRGTQVVRAIVSLGRALDITVVAEGVETEAQEEALRRMGCEYAQGYLYGRPAIPRSNAMTLLRATSG